MHCTQVASALKGLTLLLSRGARLPGFLNLMCKTVIEFVDLYGNWDVHKTTVKMYKFSRNCMFSLNYS